MSYIVRNEYGAFCSVCQSPLGLEEDDWDECDACGGEGIGGVGEVGVFEDEEEGAVRRRGLVVCHG